MVLGSPCLRKLAKLLDSIPVIALITWADLRMLLEALVSLTHDVQAPSSPGMHTILFAGPWAFRSWLGHHVDLSPGLLGSHLDRASFASWKCMWEALEWVWLCGPGHFWNSLQNACLHGEIPGSQWQKETRSMTENRPLAQQLWETFPGSVPHF